MSAAEWPITSVWRDVGFALRGRMHEGGHWLDVRLVELSGAGTGESDPLEFMTTDGNGRFVGTTDIERAIIVADGFVKWDGCCEVTVGSPDTCGHHVCGRAGLAHLISPRRSGASTTWLPS